MHLLRNFLYKVELLDTSIAVPQVYARILLGKRSQKKETVY